MPMDGCLGDQGCLAPPLGVVAKSRELWVGVIDRKKVAQSSTSLKLMAGCQVRGDQATSHIAFKHSGLKQHVCCLRPVA